MKRFLLVTALLCSVFAPAFAQGLRLPTCIESKMVLQRNADACIWGWADPSSNVKIKTSWNSKPVSVTSNTLGEWKAFLPTGDASIGETITIQSNGEKVVLKDVAIGEVWICSGQSNMQFTVEKTLDMQDFPSNPNKDIRLYNSGRISADFPQEDIPEAHWMESKASSIKPFSAVGYGFGDFIQKELGCPVGLMCLSYGGTPVEAWTPEDVVRKDPRVVKANEEMLALPKNEKRRFRLSIASEYNANIAPVVNMTVAGVIWYQGCANVSYTAEFYCDQLKAMIQSWRDEFRNPEMPFYVVQIVPQLPYKGINGAILRECQAKAVAETEHTALITTMDQVDRIGDIHPRYKMDVARRLANAALGEHYGKEVKYLAPSFASVEYEGNVARIHFDNVVDGLAGDNGVVYGVQLAGEDCRFRRAEARIEDGTVVASSAKVTAPVYVRYCFNEYPGNLKDGRGIPVGCFRTDSSLKVGDHDYVAPLHPVEIEVKGVDLDSEVSEYAEGLVPWTNRDYKLRGVVREFNGLKYVKTAWKGSGELMEPVRITAKADGEIYIMTRVLSYVYEQPGWETICASTMEYVNAKGQSKGNIYIARRSVKAGETVTLPSDKVNLAGVIPIAENITIK